MDQIPSPLHYTDYRVFLEDLYQAKKKSQPRYSYRHFSEDFGFEFSNFLHLVVRSKRNLSENAIQKIANSLRWNVHEKKYFHLLVLWNQCQKEDEKTKFRLKIEKVLKKNRSLINPDQYIYFSRWYLPVIREMVSLKNFVSHLGWISKKLKIKIDTDKIEEALKILERLGMIERIPGRWKQKEEHLTTESEVTSEMVFGYHQEMIKLSASALNFPTNFRDFSAMTLGITEKRFEWMKQRLIEFRDEIQQEVQSDEESGTLVAQLNMQFFRLTEPS